MTNREWLESLSDDDLSGFLALGIYVRDKKIPEVMPDTEDGYPISYGTDFYISIRDVANQYAQSPLGLYQWLNEDQEFEVIK